jgi:hypothetical protein
MQINVAKWRREVKKTESPTAVYNPQTKKTALNLWCDANLYPWAAHHRVKELCPRQLQSVSSSRIEAFFFLGREARKSAQKTELRGFAHKTENHDSGGYNK